MDHAPAPLRLSEQLCEKIEEQIVTGALRPGARLDEQELAAEFGVSRTPIREALIQLASPLAWYNAVPGVPLTGPFNPHFDILTYSFLNLSLKLGLKCSLNRSKTQL